VREKENRKFDRKTHQNCYFKTEKIQIKTDKMEETEHQDELIHKQQQAIEKEVRKFQKNSIENLLQNS
jgi:hypothetical protein